MMKEINEIVKERGAEVEAIRADYEALKEIIFDRLVKAIAEKRTAGYYDDYTRNAVAMERWTVLKDIIDQANLESEYNAYVRANREVE